MCPEDLYKQLFPKENFNETPLLLNLIIYNHSEKYEQQMKSILMPYLERIPNLTFYFISFRDQTKDIDVDEKEHMIWIKGIEGFIPGILKKTIEAMKLLRNKPYDYLIRSNISTVFQWSNFPAEELQEHGYSSANVIYFIPNLPFGQGTNIILRRDSSEYLIDNEKDIDWKIIDDVAIAQILLPEYGIHALDNPIEVNSENPNSFVYRNKTDWNRDEDVARMKKLVDLFMKKLDK